MGSRGLLKGDKKTYQMDSANSEEALREVYMLPFEMTLPARPAGFLMAYNRVNGSYCSESALLMGRLARTPR